MGSCRTPQTHAEGAPELHQCNPQKNQKSFCKTHREGEKFFKIYILQLFDFVFYVKRFQLGLLIFV